MPNRKLIIFAIVGVVLIQIATVATHWPDVKAGKPDFAALYGTAKLLHQGASPVYDPSAVTGVDVAADPAEKVKVPAEGTQKLDTLHPPFESLLFYPLAFLPYRTAYVVWFVINLAMFWSLPMLLWKYMPRLQIEFQYVAILLGTGLPVLVCLTFGQDSILLLLLLALSYVALEEGRMVRAGVFLGLGMFKFQLILPIVLCMAIAKNWKLIAGFFTTLFSLILVTVGVIGARESARYLPFIFKVTSHISKENSDRTGMMPNLRGLMSFLLDPFVSKITVSFVVLALSAFVFAAIWIRTSGDRKRISLEFSTYVVAAELISYHFYVYNAVVLLLPLLLIANEYADSGVSNRLKYGFAAVALSMYVAPAMVSLRFSMPISACATILLFGLLISQKANVAAE